MLLFMNVALIEEAIECVDRLGLVICQHARRSAKKVQPDSIRTALEG